MNENIFINAIYMATEGEGIRIGTPQIFVRTQGCAVGCVNCDSKETWDFDEKTAMSVSNIMSEIQEISGMYPHRIKNVSITGGDPLHPKHVPGVLALIAKLKKEGFWVNIEASGTRVLDEVFDSVDFISFDLKTPSTQAVTKYQHITKLTKQFKNKFQVKSVIADKHDFEFVYDCFLKVKEESNYADIPWFLTPCYEPGEEFPRDRFEMIISKNQEFGAPFRVVGQQHKWIHGPTKRRV
ncbi:MAG: 7-carboxy-7-deazaguanine synthase [Thermoproteota archaeon]|jgi:7-carboxy-7-deazaguanine synthase